MKYAGHGRTRKAGEQQTQKTSEHYEMHFGIFRTTPNVTYFAEATSDDVESPRSFPLDYTNAGNDLIHMGFMPMGVNSAVSQSE
ncbi:hypothetical protein [Brevundimonas sp.]|uniref:hypothetical protein n=1 Tax=Brevundimonas sp. TaxID=1871086 RepID=UPI00289EF658|nr:hypothetical protein [Brevundimonas sp.]